MLQRMGADHNPLGSHNDRGTSGGHVRSMDEAECKIVTELDLSKIEGTIGARQDILRILDSST